MAAPRVTRLVAFWRRRRKAAAGALVPIITYVAARHGLDLDPTAAALISSAITGVTVHQIRNAA